MQVCVRSLCFHFGYAFNNAHGVAERSMTRSRNKFGLTRSLLCIINCIGCALVNRSNASSSRTPFGLIIYLICIWFSCIDSGLIRIAAHRIRSQCPPRYGSKVHHTHTHTYTNTRRENRLWHFCSILQSYFSYRISKIVHAICNAIAEQ